MKYKNQKQIDEFREKFIAANGVEWKECNGYLEGPNVERIEQFIDQLLSEREEEVFKEVLGLIDAGFDVEEIRKIRQELKQPKLD